MAFRIDRHENVKLDRRQYTEIDIFIGFFFFCLMTVSTFVGYLQLNPSW